MKFQLANKHVFKFYRKIDREDIDIPLDRKIDINWQWQWLRLVLKRKNILTERLRSSFLYSQDWLTKIGFHEERSKKTIKAKKQIYKQGGFFHKIFSLDGSRRIPWFLARRSWCLYIHTRQLNRSNIIWKLYLGICNLCTIPNIFCQIYLENNIVFQRNIIYTSNNGLFYCFFVRKKTYFEKVEQSLLI